MPGKQDDYLNCGDDYLNCGDDYLDCGDDYTPPVDVEFPSDVVITPSPNPTPNPGPAPAKDNWLGELFLKFIVFLNKIFRKKRY